MAEVRISRRAGEAGPPAAVRVGDVLAVDLPENPTTGYVWSVAAVPDQLAESPVEAAADEPAGDRAGEPGRRVLRFTARSPGGGELRLRHARPWQPGGGEELVVAIRVEPQP